MFVIETGLQFEAYLTKTGGRQHHREDWYSVSHSLERLVCMWFVSGSYLSITLCVFFLGWFGDCVCHARPEERIGTSQ